MTTSGPNFISVQGHHRWIGIPQWLKSCDFLNWLTFYAQKMLAIGELVQLLTRYLAGF